MDGRCGRGGCFWGLALVGAYLTEAVESWFPQWLAELDVPDTLGTIFSVIAAPVAIGGWLLIWGDKGPPYRWLGGAAFNIAFGLCFYALLGGLVGVALSKKSLRISPSES